MKTRIPEFKHLFSKFGILSAEEIKIILGQGISRSQLNRYLAELWRLKLIRKRCHSYSDLTAFEATAELLDETRRGAKDVFRPERDDDLRHRLKCAEALIHLCRRSFITGVALEHELGAAALSQFCIERVPDGIIQITQPGSKPIEFAVEVELAIKKKERAKYILENYEKTVLGGNHQCRGLLVIATTDACYSLYADLLKGRPEKFCKWVLLSRQIDTSDINDSTLGPRLHSAYENPRNPCASRRLVTHEGVEYLNDFLIRPRLRGHRGVASQLTARQE